MTHFAGFVGYLEESQSDAVTSTPPGSPYVVQNNGYIRIIANQPIHLARNRDATTDDLPVEANTAVVVQVMKPSQDYDGDTLSYIVQDGASNGTIWFTKIH